MQQLTTYFVWFTLDWISACQTTHEVATVSDSVDKESDSVDIEIVSEEAVIGYQGIWFTLGQFSEYGDKYSGGLGTYTANHIPLAIYAEEVDKTFFVYG